MAKVEIRNLCKRYGAVTAVDGISLGIEHGEILSLLGPSGCGKTTTLNMLAGFLRPSSGSILVDDKPVEHLPPERRNTGMVFQNYALFPHLSVARNVAFGLEMRKVPAADLARRIQAAMDLARLQGLEDRLPRQLSGGQQQRVALARALVIEPSVLLLDEPLSNLDAALREEMRFEIREIQRRIGITTVFVTHDQTEAMAISRRLAVMKGGRIVQVGTPEEIYREPADAFVASFIGHANLFPGTIAGRSGAAADVRMADGTLLQVAQAGDGYAIGDPVSVVVRPEDMSIVESGTGPRNGVHAQLVESSYLGPTTRIVARVGDLIVNVASNRPAFSLTPGASIDIVWDATHCSLIKATSNAGRR